ncbi:MAG: hypothetical protein Q9160_006536 [Pyrenula sp. 1 TL-2023]
MPQTPDFLWGQQHAAGTSPFHQYQTSAVAEQGTGKKKRGKHASSKDRNAAKTTEGSPPGQAAASPPTLRPQSFGGYLPNAVPPIVDNAPQGSITSPVLEALGSNADSAYRTDVWAQSVPVGKSPPTDLLGGVSISGSPSSVAPSHVSERGVSHERGLPTDRFVSTSTPPSSPPQNKARPISYGAGISSQRSRLASNDKLPRPSFTSQFQQPPLPHHAQAHFYGAPNIDLGLGSHGSSDTFKEHVLFTKFDTLRSQTSAKALHSDRVALMGFENRLDVISLQHYKPKPIGCIDNMNGQLIDAQILTWESSGDPFADLRPLVAVVVHGPKIEINQASSSKETEEGTDLESSELLSATPQPDKTHDLGTQNTTSEVHTRVDIYSLRSQKRLTTLFATQPQQIEPSFRGLPNIIPAPIGDIKVAVAGDYIFVTSIASGEIYVYTVQISQHVQFQCLGKCWTTVQSKDVRRYSSSSASTEASASPADVSRAINHPEQPLMTVSSRWLAFVPPGGAGRTSIHGYVPSSLVSGKPPGLDSFTAPPKPSVTCAIDSPDVESIFNTVARGVAQEVVKGARWMGDQGLQAWNNYWNKDSTTHPQNPSSARTAQLPNIPASYFPPTHGLETQNPSFTDPELVSIIDLSRLNAVVKSKSHHVLEPIITFQPPSGCSYISFSPDGLSMMTSSKRGDIQHVWDLKQARHRRMATLVSDHPASVDLPPATLIPQVRQIARFTRLSSASITDVVWTGPTGERLAVITRNGTVHVFDIPPSAFMWPPPRRFIKQPASVADNAISSTIEKEDSLASEGFLASAWKAAGRAQPMLANLRGRAPSIGGTFSGIGANSIGFASATGVKGGKAVAAGLSKSVGAASGTVNTLRHAGENRLHLSSLAKNPSPGRVCWHIGEKEEFALLVIDGSLFKRYRVRRSAVATEKGQRSRLSSVIEIKRPSEARLPTLDNVRYAAEAIQAQRYSGFEEANQLSHSYWTLPTATNPEFSSPYNSSHSHPLSHAEIETNSPYQPFHSDRRVNLFVYTDPPTRIKPHLEPADQSVSTVLSPHSGLPNRPPPHLMSLTNHEDSDKSWIFGTDVHVERLNLHHFSADEDDLENDSLSSVIYRETAHNANGATAPSRGGDEPVEEIVITTRKRKGKSKAAVAPGVREGVGMIEGEDEDFFEDDLEIVDWVGDRV